MTHITLKSKHSTTSSSSSSHLFVHQFEFWIFSVKPNVLPYVQWANDEICNCYGTLTLFGYIVSRMNTWFTLIRFELLCCISFQIQVVEWWINYGGRNKIEHGRCDICSQTKRKINNDGTILVRMEICDIRMEIFATLAIETVTCFWFCFIKHPPTFIRFSISFWCEICTAYMEESLECLEQNRNW